MDYCDYYYHEGKNGAVTPYLLGGLSYTWQSEHELWSWVVFFIDIIYLPKTKNNSSRSITAGTGAICNISNSRNKLHIIKTINKSVIQLTVN